MTELLNPEPGCKPEYPIEAQTQFTLACVRTARTRLHLMLCELDEIGVGLKFNMLPPAEAVAWMSDLGVLRYVNNGLWRDFDTESAA